MIRIKTPQEINIMAEGGKVLAKILQAIAEKVKPGITTMELNKAASDLVFACGGNPAFLGYQGFPAALCTSVNEEIVHGVPSERKLKEGEIIGLDLGILYPVAKCSHCPMGASCNPENKPFFVDAALTVPVGEISNEAEKLIKVAKGALDVAIEKIKPGAHLGDIGFAIQKYVEGEGFSVIRNLVGHGVGYELHEDPEVPNFGQVGEGPVLKEGMTLAIEPMIAAGDWKVRQNKNSFAFETQDKSLAAHSEHTVAVTKDGCEVLTRI
ncbi:MAG: methionyl aminopeptidase [Candidatus Portnoybacteria bacterium]|nr:methionyl aminopeptidase [Candidatus Portnoybacteria bacterium]